MTAAVTPFDLHVGMESPPRVPLQRRLLTWVCLVGIFFAANFPMLSWLGFTNTLEDLNVATALEMRRTGHWLEPTLEGDLRTKKPPLVAWITAAAIRTSTLRDISHPDESIRAGGYDALAVDVRWPALLSACLTLAGIYELALVVLRDETFALGAGCIAGSTFFFLRYARVAGIDGYLMFCVTWADVFLVRAIFDGRRWGGCIAAGAAIGAAFMCKGPVALLQTVVPVIVLACAVSIARKGDSKPQAERVKWIGPIIAGLLAWMVVALPWYVLILARNPERQWSIWFKEVTGSDAPERADRPWVYFAIVPLLLPWAFYFIAGIWRLVRSRWKTMRNDLLLMLLLIVVPLVVMFFFKDRKDRYMLPLLGPAAVLAAAGLRWTFPIRWLRILHWATLATATIGLAIAGLFLRRETNEPWFPPLLAAVAAAIFLALIRIGFIRTWRHSDEAGSPMPSADWRMMVAVTSLVMLLANALFLFGFRNSPSAGSDLRSLADEIWQKYPDAEIFTAETQVGKRLSTELSIYLNRSDRWISPDSIAGMRPAIHPMLVFLVLSRNQQYTPPTHWKLLAELPRGNSDQWDVLLLDAIGR